MEKPFEPLRDVEEFHSKYGLLYDGKPRALPQELAGFRQGFLGEELREYLEHASAAAAELAASESERDPANYAFHLEQMLDALVDLVYVALGTSQLHGFDFREAWRRVHAKNMMKVRAERADQSKRGSAFDVVKPAGWTPASLIDLVEDNDLASK